MAFYTRISGYYNEIFPLNKAQVNFVNELGVKGLNILDIGCGTGNLSAVLAEGANSVVAIDINNEMLEIARHKAQRSNVKFEKTSMLQLESKYDPDQFDTVLCFGNTLVHLTDIELIKSFIKQVRQVLKHNGKFLFQIINYDNVIDNNLKGLPTIENDKVRFERKYTFNQNGLIEFETILIIKETMDTISNCVELYPLRKDGVENILGNSGFSEINSYSSFKKDPYNPNSIPLVFECC